MLRWSHALCNKATTTIRIPSICHARKTNKAVPVLKIEETNRYNVIFRQRMCMLFSLSIQIQSSDIQNKHHTFEGIKMIKRIFLFLFFIFYFYLKKKTKYDKGTKRKNEDGK